MADAKAVADRFLSAFNAHDENAMRSLTDDKATFTGPGGVSLSGGDATHGYAMAWLNAFPDGRINIQSEIVADPWVVMEFTFEGTHKATLKGPAGDIPATGKRLVVRGAELNKVQDGKVVDTRLYFDQVDVLTQLGLMPPTGT